MPDAREDLEMGKMINLHVRLSSTIKYLSPEKVTELVDSLQKRVEDAEAKLICKACGGTDSVCGLASTEEIQALKKKVEDAEQSLESSRLIAKGHYTSCLEWEKHSVEVSCLYTGAKQEIEALKAENASLLHYMTEANDARSKNIALSNQLSAQAKALEEARNFMEHGFFCSIRAARNNPCDCGLTDLLRRLPPESKETPNCTGCHPQIEGRQGTHQMGTVEHPWPETCKRCEGDGVEPKIGTRDLRKGGS